jgi:hypothetical protein
VPERLSEDPHTPAEGVPQAFELKAPVSSRNLETRSDMPRVECSRVVRSGRRTLRFESDPGFWRVA